ncbi:MAG: alpha/beta hydrolase [Candidatus Contendobacter sp.]|nr:alpha/beta hydrolase [Candidatus Contendobacter sp.]
MPVTEETVFFDSSPFRLEGRLYRASGPNAVVLTHPHPLYGGEMDNPVVTTLVRVYQRLGYSTLRFNFRGVGASGGDYGDGIGERDDARAAAAYLSRLDKTVTDLAGYSFGAWINLGLHPPLTTVRRQVVVAPPVLFMDFEPVTAPPAELAVIVGDQDRMAPLATLRALLPHWHPAAQLCVVTGADHFFGAALDRLTAQVEAVLTERS